MRPPSGSGGRAARAKLVASLAAGLVTSGVPLVLHGDASSRGQGAYGIQPLLNDEPLVIAAPAANKPGSLCNQVELRRRATTPRISEGEPYDLHR